MTLNEVGEIELPGNYSEDKNMIDVKFEFNDKEHQAIVAQNSKEHQILRAELDELIKLIQVQDKDYTGFKNKIIAYGSLGALFLSSGFAWLFRKLFG